MKSVIEAGEKIGDVVDALFVMYEEKNIELLTFMKLIDLLDFELEEEFFNSLSETEKEKVLKQKENRFQLNLPWVFTPMQGKRSKIL